MPTNTSIAITTNTKEKLMELKVHPRETFDDLINRLIDTYSEAKNEKDTPHLKN